MMGPDDLGPRRLKDDPDFRWETGCDLSAEEEAVGAFDHEKMRARLVAAALAGAPPAIPAGPKGPSPWWAFAKPVAGVVALVGALGTAYVAGLRAGSEPQPAASVAPIEAPLPQRVVPPPAVPSALPVVEEAVVVPVVVPPPPERVPTLVAPVPTALEPAAPTAEVGVVPPAPVVAEVEPPVVVLAAPSRSTMGPQLAQYDRALEQLERGEHAAARDGFLLYLATWPDGDLRPEAQIGLLQSLHGTGDAAAAESLAAKLQDLPDFRDRRSNILRLRAESLVVLGRCDEAVSVAADLSSREQADIRRACRSMRREGQ